MGRRSGLGKGLGALIPTAEEPGRGLTMVPVSAISPNPLQPRSSLDRQALADDTIREGHARCLLSLATPEAQMAALKTVIDKALSVRQTEELVRRLLAEPPPSKPHEPPDSESEALETEFRHRLGTRVDLHRSRQGRGRLIIHFYSEEELQAIYDTIVGGV